MRVQLTTLEREESGEEFAEERRAPVQVAPLGRGGGFQPGFDGGGDFRDLRVRDVDGGGCGTAPRQSLRNGDNRGDLHLVRRVPLALHVQGSHRHLGLVGSNHLPTTNRDSPNSGRAGFY